MKKILETVIKYGARMAEPGEFTKRAFLNGRIDLSQAEAVIDVINSKNNYALKSSVSQLSGSMSKKVKELREKLLFEIAFIESALDDPEHISLDGYPEKLKVTVNDMQEELNRAISTFDSGRVLSEGIRTVILGKPNAGKSSLMNVLVGEERGNCNRHCRNYQRYAGGKHTSSRYQPEHSGHGRYSRNGRCGGKNRRG